MLPMFRALSLRRIRLRDCGGTSVQILCGKFMWIEKKGRVSLRDFCQFITDILQGNHLKHGAIL